MGIFLLHEDLDPTNYKYDPDYLSGDIVGLNNNFKGMGLIFDTYDNDERHDNPAIFVIENLNPPLTSPVKKFDHHNDYSDTMYKEIASEETMQNHLIKKNARAYRCAASIRNTGRNFKALIKYIDNVLHVYIKTNTMKKGGYRFCLSVAFDRKIKFTTDYHLVLTGSTGDVYDNHDIIKLETRYLPINATVDDNDYLDELEYTSSTTNSFDALLLLSLFSLTSLVGYQYYILNKMLNQRLDTIMICNQINPFILPHYVIHGIITILLLLCGYYFGLLFNLPIFIIHIIEIIKNSYQYRAYLLAKLSSKANINSPKLRLLALLIWYIISFIFYFFSIA